MSEDSFDKILKLKSMLIDVQDRADQGDSAAQHIMEVTSRFSRLVKISQEL